MSIERKPSDDLREGLGLLFRAAKGAVLEVTKEVDLAKAARTAGSVAEQASRELARVATLFGQTFEREIAVQSKDEAAEPNDVTAPVAEQPASGSGTDEMQG